MFDNVKLLERFYMSVATHGHPTSPLYVYKLTSYDAINQYGPKARTSMVCV
jgi:hypothetical protein